MNSGKIAQFRRPVLPDPFCARFADPFCHVWQGRFYSCPLDRPHLWGRCANTELNPVRAGMVAEPDDYLWSSAAAHCGSIRPDASAGDAALARSLETPLCGCEYLRDTSATRMREAIRRCTHTGRRSRRTRFRRGSGKGSATASGAAKRRPATERGIDAKQQAFGFGQL